ncbi:catalytic domain of components of various dehydrogenase complexes [Xylanimonas cellulosilytica DSM 15894]|uniref:Dihydrolipoamide acetyltransferase component of pyruvate dehydrogenase complex n=1 Tax=Xylanimonas cellulosilytica (strain DSM 15894 / JCM 12276 / CECT 5975 / KCTC 9989 / LMG 20990 / NBRC 107835 / XIL07) TaxID=446471 RepID=D1BUA4_XYLCX|nr:catalytic domain of components of various dehydrogenase complexes [Xylanimonas cellulosilytica DSM 15894]
MTAREFLLPDLGEGLTESDLVTWHVAVGDTVTLNQVIAEVETAKALVDLPSPVAGVVTALHAQEGQTVGVGAPLVTFEVSDDGDAGGSAFSGGFPAPATVSAPSSSAQQGEPAGPTLVGYGAAPERGGHPTRRPRRYAVPATMQGAAAASSLLPAEVTPLSAVSPADRARSTPGVRAFARRLGVDLAGVPGTGPDGRVTRQDVEAASAAGSAGSAGSAGAAPGASAASAGETRTPVRGVRKHTAAAMVASAFTAPQASVLLTVDATASMELLDRLRGHRLARGERVTVLALVARAVCALLGAHPTLNSRWVDLPDGSAEIAQPAHVNLGIAVATERGLVVPNLPAAETLGLAELAAALTALTRTAREGRTAPERLAGGTFTITNVGVFGVDAGTPILNPGESGILGLGQVRRLPWEHDGQVALRDVVTLSLTFDHRVVDGEQAARFLADLGAVLSDPALTLLVRSQDPAPSVVEPVETTQPDTPVVEPVETTPQRNVASTGSTTGATRQRNVVSTGSTTETGSTTGATATAKGRGAS